ncbi:hypothetical protein Tco_0992122, partial [Tanacetum coccineum]
DLSHSEEIKVITDVNVNKLHQPWRSFVVVINKCLSGKSTGYDSLRLSQAQILWGMYHKKNVNYAYLLWEEFVYQVENKNVKRSNEMYYPRFTKVIVNFFMTKDQSIPRRNKPSKILNPIKSAIASETEPLKTKASVKKKQVGSDKTKTPTTTKGKRLKTSAKAAKPAKKKQPAKTSKAKGLTVLSEKSSDEEDDDEVAMSGDDDDDPDNQDNDDNDDDDQNDDNTDNENDDNDDDDGQDHEQTDSDKMVMTLVQTPSHVESTDDEDSDEEIQGMNVEGEELDEEEINEEDKANELYKDVNVNLEGRDTEMTDAPRTIIQTTQVIEDTYVIITPVNPEGQQQSSSVSSGFVSNMLNPSPDTCINSIFNLNTESTSLVDVLVTTIAEPPLLSATTLPPPPTPLIIHLQQTPVPTPRTVPSSSLQDLPNFVVSSILGIIDVYLANKMHEFTGITTDQLDWNNPEGQQYPHDLNKPLPLIPNSRGRQVIPFDHFINNDLAYLSGGISSRKCTTSVMKTKAADYGHIKWIEDLVPNRMEFSRDVYSKRKIIAIIKHQIVEWHNYKHLDWITVRRDDEKLYTFKEGDFNRFCIQDIEDMLLLLVQGKLTNLTVEEHLSFNVSLQMFTRSIVIQRHAKDLQLGNKYKKNKLMRIDELHKFSDGTLNDIRTALNDHLKGIRIKYLPQTIWRQSDRDKAGAMI